jgi:hypothetical protein
MGFDQTAAQIFVNFIHSNIQDDPTTYPGNVIYNAGYLAEYLETNQISLDPMLGPDPTLALNVDSPCIDAGTGDYNLDGVVDALDLVFDDITIAEHYGDAPDIGYLEYACQEDGGDGTSLLDACGYCYGSVEDDGFISDVEDCPEEGVALLGDLSGDGQLNVLDLVQLANFILGQSGAYNEVGDMNQDGTHNVMDIVTLANIILSNGLAREEATPTEAVIKYGHGKLELSSDGLLGGMQLPAL